jgi:16S rRNA C967 or C1407 C5-methylase (RsmB/RsmF family)/NOL1/NOP2/fmu family ribosome biogenesis protein
LSPTLPSALVASLHGIPGFDPESFIAVHEQGEQVSSIRINPTKPGVVATTMPFGVPVPWCAGGWYLKERPSYTLDPFFHAGHYYVQEASSMFLDHALRHVLGSERGLKALDLCAAPGGKSTLLASLPHFRMVVANELIRTRLSMLTENIAKWGMPHVLVSHNDPREAGRLEGFFDVLVVDAPCSGSGLFRRDPEAISEWSERNVQHCSERQQRILADALPALRSDGVLVYSTCSYSREEDEMILDWLLQHGEFESLEVPVEEHWGINVARSPKGCVGYRFFPGNVKGEGLFMALLRKKEGTTYHPGRLGRMETASSADRRIADPWFRDPASLALIRKANDLFAVPADILDDLQQVQSHLQVRKTGIFAGSLAHEEFLPEHELAVSIILADGLPSVDLTLDEALDYLRKKNVGPFGDRKGWHLMRHAGAALGWAKILPNRVNNYYPAAWRILNL